MYVEFIFTALTQTFNSYTHASLSDKSHCSADHYIYHIYKHGMVQILEPQLCSNLSRRMADWIRLKDTFDKNRFPVSNGLIFNKNGYKYVDVFHT